MKLLLNLSRVVSGGGQQVAFSLLQSLHEDPSVDLYVYVTRGSQLHEHCIRILSEDKLFVLNKEYISSTLKAIVCCWVYLKTVKIINFGVAIPLVRNKQIVRSVFSNLYYPEIDFWEDIASKKVRTYKRVKDYFRLKGTLKADLIWFENRDMLNRSIKLFGRSRSSVFYCSPALSQRLKRNTEISSSSRKRIFYPASPYVNKGFAILPEVASKLKSLGETEIVFVLSFSESDHSDLLNRIIAYDVREYFEFVGTLEVEGLCEQYELSTAVLLLSKLECFSSSVIESAFFEKILIGTNASWLKTELGDDCIYVDRNDSDSIVEAILKLKDVSTISFLRILNKFHTVESRLICLKEALEIL